MSDQATYPQIERRAHHHANEHLPAPECEARIAGIKNDLKSDIVEIKTTLKELSLSLTKLVLLEERQTQQFAAQERIFKVLEKLEARVSMIEVVQPRNNQTSGWVEKTIWAAAVVVALFVAKKVGLM